MSFALSWAIRLQSSRVIFFQRYFSSSVSWITSGTSNTSCSHLWEGVNNITREGNEYYEAGRQEHCYDTTVSLVRVIDHHWHVAQATAVGQLTTPQLQSTTGNQDWAPNDWLLLVTTSRGSYPEHHCANEFNIKYKQATNFRVEPSQQITEQVRCQCDYSSYEEEENISRNKGNSTAVIFKIL